MVAGHDEINSHEINCHILCLCSIHITAPHYCPPPQVVHGCDPNAWHMGSDSTTLTLLHRAILLKDTPTACFLIRNGADINSPSRPGKDGGQFSPPLHMACESGMQEVVQCLVDHNADVNAKVGTRRVQAKDI